MFRLLSTNLMGYEVCSFQKTTVSFSYYNTDTVPTIYRMRDLRMLYHVLYTGPVHYTVTTWGCNPF